MAKTVIVPMAAIDVAQKPDLLQTQALGSCVGIVLYDPVSGVGGMAHPMLPSIGRSREKSKDQRGKFVDSSIEDLFVMVLKRGALTTSIFAKLAGGANMFPEIVRRDGNHIGAQNVESAKAKLAEMNVPVIAEDVGGSIGRTITLDTSSGVVTVRSAYSDIKEL